MNKATDVISKAAALLSIMIGLIAMVAAWDLLLLANSHSITILAMEMGGVILCLIGYFLWHRKKRAEEST
jgi:hypothetical protein